MRHLERWLQYASHEERNSGAASGVGVFFGAESHADGRCDEEEIGTYRSFLEALASELTVCLSVGLCICTAK